MKGHKLIHITFTLLLMIVLATVSAYAENGPDSSEAYIMFQGTNQNDDGSYTQQYIWLGSEETSSLVKKVDGANYNKETNTLTLNNADMSTYILETSAMGDDFKIYVKGTNQLAGITAWSGSPNISGTGTQTLNTNKIGNKFGNSTVLTYATGTDSKLSVGSSVKLVAYKGEHDYLLTIGQSKKSQAPVSILGTPSTYSFKKLSDGRFVCENDSLTVTPRRTIKFDANGGKNLSMKSKKVTDGKTLDKLPTAKRKGYILKGWYTEKEGGKKYTSTEKIQSSCTLYARWTKVTVNKAGRPAVNSTGKGKITVKIGKVTGAKGYRIAYSTDYKFKTAKTVTITGRSKTIKNLKGKRTYYVKVRAYKKDSYGNKVFGPYSNVAKIIFDGGENYGLPALTSIRTKDDGDKLVLVNKQNGLSSKYRPTGMVRVKNSLSTNKNLYFKKEAYNAYLKMRKAANKKGISFLICSAYRSYSTQKSIYMSHIARTGVKQTNTVSAYPGRSEHQTGWAVDITSRSMGYGLSQRFAKYPEGKWIGKHCSEYGFILRYPKGKSKITGYSYEPWHLRYVGVNVAKEITSLGITYEEYLDKLPVKLTAKSMGKGKINVKIGKVTIAKGYQIVYSTSSKFKGTKSVVTTSRSKTISKLTSKKTYYVKVRAYKKDSYGNKVYGSYSKVAKIKVK